MEKRGILIPILVMAFLVWGSWLVAQEETNRELENLWQQALDLYDRGQYDEAYQKVNAILLKQPTSEEALALREKAGMRRMMQMLVKDDKWRQIAEALLQRAEKAQLQRETDLEQIGALVRQAASGNLLDRSEAIRKLQGSVGERAVIHMIPYLKDRTQDQERINITYAAIKMGRSIVIPLIEALNSNDAFLRQQVSIILGHIGDWRATPDLQRLIENPKESEEVKEYARKALKKIAVISEEALRRLKISVEDEAKHLYYQRALAYYNNNPYVYPVQKFDWLRWQWQDEKLAFQEVPSFAYNEIMAEESCYDALALDATYEDVWALLLKVYYAQANQAKEIEFNAKDRELTLPEREQPWFEKDKPAALWAGVVAAAGGPEVLYKALATTLENKNEVPVAVALIKALANEVGTGQSPAAPLINALSHRDKRIKYAAAEALVKIKPLQPFSNTQLVIKVLEEALGESDARVILVIEDDTDVRNQLVGELNEMKPGFVAFGAHDGLHGLQRACQFPSEDLIIVASELKDIATVQVVNRLREDFRTVDIPFLILCPEDQKEKQMQLYQDIPTFKGVIVKPVAKEVYESKVKEALDTAKGDYKSQAREIVRRAAQSLASIDPDTSIYKLRKALEGLINVLEKRHDSIRGPAIVALGKIGDAKAIPALMNLVKDPLVKKDIRIKAACALGKIYGKTQVKVATEDLENLLTVMGEKSEQEEEQAQLKELKLCVAQALGQANLSPEERLKVFKLHRAHQKIVTTEED